MRFLSLLAIASIAFCVSMCTPSPSNNVTPTTNTPVGNCNDGIKNGTETEVDCGGNCVACNGGYVTFGSRRTGIMSSQIVNLDTITLIQIAGATFYKDTVPAKSDYLTFNIYKNRVNDWNLVKGYYKATRPSILGGLVNPAPCVWISYNGAYNYPGEQVVGGLNITDINISSKTFSGNYDITRNYNDGFGNKTMRLNGTFVNVKYK